MICITHIYIFNLSFNSDLNKLIWIKSINDHNLKHKQI